MIANDWTDENEVYIQSIGEQASSLEWMNLQEEKKYRRNMYILNVLANFFAMGAALFSVIESFKTSIYITILIKVTTIISAAIVKYQTSSKFLQVADIHKKIASDYHKIFDEVQYQLALSRENRQRASEFIREIRAKYTGLNDSSPSISNRIINDFNTRYKLSGITKPIIVGDLNKIPVSRSGDNESRAILKPPDLKFSSQLPKENWRRKLSRSVLNPSIEFSYSEYARSNSNPNRPVICKEGAQLELSSSAPTISTHNVQYYNKNGAPISSSSFSNGDQEQIIVTPSPDEIGIEFGQNVTNYENITQQSRSASMPTSLPSLSSASSALTSSSSVPTLSSASSSKIGNFSHEKNNNSGQISASSDPDLVNRTNSSRDDTTSSKSRLHRLSPVNYLGHK